MEPRIQQVSSNLEEDSWSLLMLQVEQTRNIFSSKEVFHIQGNHENDDNNILVIDGTKPLLACSLGTLKQWLKQGSRRPFPKEPRYRWDQWNTLRAAYAVYWWNHFRPVIAWQKTSVGKSLVTMFRMNLSIELRGEVPLEEATSEMKQMLEVLVGLQSVRHRPLNKMVRRLKQCIKQMPEKKAAIQQISEVDQLSDFVRQRATILNSWWRWPKWFWLRWTIFNYEKKYATYCAWQASNEAQTFMLRVMINNNSISQVNQYSLGRGSMLSTLIEEAIHQLLEFVHGNVQRKSKKFRNKEDGVSAVKIALFGAINNLVKDLGICEAGYQDAQSTNSESSQASSSNSLPSERELPLDFVESVEKCITHIVHIDDLLLCPLLESCTKGWATSFIEALATMLPEDDQIFQLVALQQRIRESIVPRLNLLIVQRLLLMIRESYATFQATLEEASFQKLVTDLKAFEQAEAVKHILKYPKLYQSFETMPDSSQSGIRAVLVNLLKVTEREKKVSFYFVDTLGVLKKSLDASYTERIRAYIEKRFQDIYENPLTSLIDWRRWRKDLESLARGHPETRTMLEEMQREGEYVARYQMLCQRLEALLQDPSVTIFDEDSLARSIQKVMQWLNAQENQVEIALQIVGDKIIRVSQRYPSLVTALTKQDMSVAKKNAELNTDVMLPFAYKQADIITNLRLINRLFPEIDIVGSYTALHQKRQSDEKLSHEEILFINFLAQYLLLKDFIAILLPLLESEPPTSELSVAWSSLRALHGAQQTCLSNVFAFIDACKTDPNPGSIEERYQELSVTYAERKAAIEGQYEKCFALLKEHEGDNDEMLEAFAFIQAFFEKSYQGLFNIFQTEGLDLVQRIARLQRAEKVVKAKMNAAKEKMTEADKKMAELEKRERSMVLSELEVKIRFLEINLGKAENAVQKAALEPEWRSLQEEFTAVYARVTADAEHGTDQDILTKLDALQVLLIKMESLWQEAPVTSVFSAAGPSGVASGGR